MPGKKMNSIRNVKAYEAMRNEGMSKQKAAKISNAQVAKARRPKKRSR